MTPSSSTGYTRPLYLSPVDHRASFQSGMFGWTGELTADQTACVAADANRNGFITAASVEMSGEQEFDFEYGADFAVVDAARRNGRTRVGCIVLGRGESEQHVKNWLRVAREVPGFIGFAVGRSTFWEPLLGWRDGRPTVAEAAAQIAARYREWVQIFEVGHDQLEAA